MFCGCKVTKKSRLTYSFFGNNATDPFFARFYPAATVLVPPPSLLAKSTKFPRFALKAEERVGGNLSKPPIGILQRFARTADVVSQMSWSSGRVSIIQANHSRPVLTSGRKMSVPTAEVRKREVGKCFAMLISVESRKLMAVKMMNKYLCCMFASVWFIVVCFFTTG